MITVLIFLFYCSEIDQLVRAIEDSDVVPKATLTDASPIASGEQDSTSQFHIKTKSEKKEAKKEKERRQKELKKQSKQADKGDIETTALSTSNPLHDKPASVDDSAATCDPDPLSPSLPTVEQPSANDPLVSTSQTIEDDVGQEEENDKDDDKKKKKKKKKKGEKEEDKKAAKVFTSQP